MDQVEDILTTTSSDVKYANAVSMIYNTDEEANDSFPNSIRYLVLKQTESWKDVHIDDDIQDPDRSDVLHMLESYSDVLTDRQYNMSSRCLTINLSQYLSIQYIFITKSLSELSYNNL